MNTPPEQHEVFGKSSANAPKVVLVAGEASGDLHGARLARDLKELHPGVELSGIGGPAMDKEGVRLIFRAEDLALVGVTEVLPKLGVILGALRGMKRHLAQTRPDLVILIDFPDFNFRVGKAAKKLGLKVLYYVCPQVWAWRRKRARTMSSFVDRLAVVFPFEIDFLKEIAPDLKAEFVGHPLLDHPPAEAGEENWPVPRGSTLVGLLPGSRMSEIKRLLPLLLKSAAIMQKKRPDLHFVLPMAPGLDRAKLDPYLAGAPTGLTILQNRAQMVMARSRVILAASGTATLQTALAGTPMVVVYKTGLVNYLLAKSLVKVDFIAMPNLIAGREVAPELIQGAARPGAVAAKALEMLDDGPLRRDILEGLALVKQRMGGPGAGRRVAGLASELMDS